MLSNFFYFTFRKFFKFVSYSFYSFLVLDKICCFLDVKFSDFANFDGFS